MGGLGLVFLVVVILLLRLFFLLHSLIGLKSS